MKRAFKQPLTADESWNRDRCRIHALKGKVKGAQPGYTDDNYRDTILDISQGRTDSSTGLKPTERTELISRLSVLAGEQPRPSYQRRDKRSYPKRPKNMDKGGSRADQLGKIEALLTVGKKEWAYADGIAKRVCKVDKVQWVETDDLYKIITALRMQAKREKWDLSGEK